MRLLRECSTSYSFPQVRAMLAAAMQRELSHEDLEQWVYGDGYLGQERPVSARALAFKVAFMLLPSGNETRKRRKPAKLRQRELPHMPEARVTRSPLRRMADALDTGDASRPALAALLIIEAGELHRMIAKRLYDACLLGASGDAAQVEWAERLEVALKASGRRLERR